jgi:4-hydroxy-tetrahydrodipicolinate synthase
VRAGNGAIGGKPKRERAKFHVTDVCIDEARSRAPDIAGAGSGAEAAVVTPYCNKPTQEGLYRHFKAFDNAVGVPILIDNLPLRSVVDVAVDRMKRL